jgi:methylase of polypeptide subunit release factors
LNEILISKEPGEDDCATAREDAALLDLVALLRDAGYHFTTVTPLTQARVNKRPSNAWATDLVGVFGWSRPFHQDLLPDSILTLMRAAQVLAVIEGDRCISRIRVSTLGTQLFIHSAFPTTEPDSVFFGPDTVRFVQAIDRHLKERNAPIERVADIGCGAGAGGIAIAAARPNAGVLMLDINPRALRYARVNAAINRVSVGVVRSDILASTVGLFDLIVSNPPYLIDRKERAYRHGGGALGEGLSVEIVRQSLPRLSAGGSLLLYTGSTFISGRDAFASVCVDLLRTPGLRWSYAEIDPDVFGEELEEPAYVGAERIAVVLLTGTKEGP